MKSHLKKTFGAALATVAYASLVSVASAQFNYDPYHDPKNTDPVDSGTNATDPYVFAGANPFLSTIIGISGSYTYGPVPNGPYPFGGLDHDVPGAIAFATILGSGLTATDDFVALTGALFTNVNQKQPPLPSQLLVVPSNRYGYASIRLIDSGGTTTDARVGEDNEYGVTPSANFRTMTLSSAVETVDASCKVDLIGSSLKFEWTLTNTDAEAAQIGFRFAHGTVMRNQTDSVPGPAKFPMVINDRGRNLLLQNAWTRGVSTDYPDFMDFYFAQSLPYPSMRFRFVPDETHPDATPVDRVALGSTLDSVWEFNPISVFHGSALMMYWNPISVPAGANRKITYYVELGGIVNDPTLPYAVTTETEHLIGFDSGGKNLLGPNPFQIVGYADNQYARLNQAVTLENVEVTITLPEHLTLAPGEQTTKSTGPIGPNQVEQVQWNVVADGLEPGIYPYSLTFDPTGPSTSPTKVISNVVIVGLTPTVDLREGPNLLTIPWSLPANTFNGVGLGGFEAYDWDPVSQTYATTTTIRRGFGQWLVAAANPAPITLPNASSFGDETLGQFRQVTKRRWNMLGNPYPYPIKISQLIGVSATDPTESLTWEQMVNRGYIRPYVFVYNSDTGEYELLQGTNYIQPGDGFWMYNSSADDLDLIWPSVLLPGLPGSNLLQNGPQMAIGEWKFDLKLKSANGSDSTNMIGIANNQYNADQMSVAEPPRRPGGAPQLFIALGEGPGVEPMSRMFQPRGFVNRFTAVANVSAGTYTMNWGFMRSMPPTARIQMKDMRTGAIVNLRTSRGYSFVANQPESRRFEITVTHN